MKARQGIPIARERIDNVNHQSVMSNSALVLAAQTARL